MSRPARVLGVVGARPQFIKAAAVHRAWSRQKGPDRFQLQWLHTGQHYDAPMSDVFFKEFQLPKPDYRLNPSRGSGPDQFADILRGMSAPLERSRPDAVLVFGDTNSTLAAALAAAYAGIPVAHVEAGLRSFNEGMPEERNRVLTDHMSRWLFCPTRRAVDQLERENIRRGVHHVGDVMADLILEASGSLPKPAVGAPYYLATIHRNTNTDDAARLGSILEALEAMPIPVLMPLHPRTASRIHADRKLKKLTASFKRLWLTEPQSYGGMIALMKASAGIITDSGGVQKEAFLLGVPCVTLRAETEWVETVELGRNRLCAPSALHVIRAFKQMSARWKKTVPPVYGKGDAAAKLLNILAREVRR